MGAWEGLGAGRKGLVARHRLCMEHGTLEDRGEARARGCKRSGREGWSLATVYVWSTARGRRARGSSARRRLWSTRDARAHIAVRAAAADAPGPGAAPCTPQRDGSGAPTTRRLVPVMFFSSAPTGGSSAPSASLEPRSASSEPRPAFCPPSSESMAPRRGKDEHGVVAALAEVGECEPLSSVKRQASTQIWNFLIGLP